MLSAFIKFGDGQISTATDESELLRALRDPGAIFWVDMAEPVDEELALLDDVFGFHPLAIEDTTQYNQRPKIESYNHFGAMTDSGYYYLVIHGPDLSTFKEHLRTKELDIFFSERYLVTIHVEPMRSITDTIATVSANPTRAIDAGVDMLLYNILDHVVDNYTPIFDFMQEELDEMEEDAINNPTQALLTRIGTKKRELLTLRRVIGPQREVIGQLARGDVPFIREQARVYLRDVQDHLIRAVETIEIYRDLVLGTRDIYLSSLSNYLNQIMKTLTIISVVTLPITLVTSFFGMNFEALPGQHSKDAFWIAVLFMVTVVSAILVVFRRKKWI